MSTTGVYFSELKGKLHQLREIRQQVEKPYVHHVNDVRQNQANRNSQQSTKIIESNIRTATAALPQIEGTDVKEGMLSQSLLSRSTSFNNGKQNSDHAELEALQKRYSSTVRLLAESLEEQSNLRAIVDLTSNPSTIDAILQQEVFRMAIFGSELANQNLKEEEEWPVLLRSTKIRALMIEKDDLLRQTIDLRTRLDHEKAKKNEAETQLKVTETLYQDSQRDLESAHSEIQQLQEQLLEIQHNKHTAANIILHRPPNVMSKGKWQNLFDEHNGVFAEVDLLPPPPPEEDYDEMAEPLEDKNQILNIPSASAQSDVKKPLTVSTLLANTVKPNTTKPPRTPPALHQRRQETFISNNRQTFDSHPPEKVALHPSILEQLENKLRQQPEENRMSRVATMSFEDFEIDVEVDKQYNMHHHKDNVHADIESKDEEEDLLHSLDGSFHSNSHINVADEVDSVADEELSDDDFPCPSVNKKSPDNNGEDIGDEYNSGEEEYNHLNEEFSVHSEFSLPSMMILSIDLDQSGPNQSAELEVRSDTLPAAAALSFLQRHKLSPEYFEPLMHQIEQLKRTLQQDRQSYFDARQGNSAETDKHSNCDTHSALNQQHSEHCWEEEEAENWEEEEAEDEDSKHKNEDEEDINVAGEGEGEDEEDSVAPYRQQLLLQQQAALQRSSREQSMTKTPPVDRKRQFVNGEFNSNKKDTNTNSNPYRSNDDVAESGPNHHADTGRALSMSLLSTPSRFSPTGSSRAKMSTKGTQTPPLSPTSSFQRSRQSNHNYDQHSPSQWSRDVLQFAYDVQDFDDVIVENEDVKNLDDDYEDEPENYVDKGHENEENSRNDNVEDENIDILGELEDRYSQPLAPSISHSNVLAKTDIKPSSMVPMLPRTINAATAPSNLFFHTYVPPSQPFPQPIHRSRTSQNPNLTHKQTVQEEEDGDMDAASDDNASWVPDDDSHHSVPVYRANKQKVHLTFQNQSNSDTSGKSSSLGMIRRKNNTSSISYNAVDKYLSSSAIVDSKPNIRGVVRKTPIQSKPSPDNDSPFQDYVIDSEVQPSRSSNNASTNNPPSSAVVPPTQAFKSPAFSGMIMRKKAAEDTQAVDIHQQIHNHDSNKSNSSGNNRKPGLEGKQKVADDKQQPSSYNNSSFIRPKSKLSQHQQNSNHHTEEQMQSPSAQSTSSFFSFASHGASTNNHSSSSSPAGNHNNSRSQPNTKSTQSQSKPQPKVTTNENISNGSADNNTSSSGFFSSFLRSNNNINRHDTNNDKNKNHADNNSRIAKVPSFLAQNAKPDSSKIIAAKGNNKKVDIL